MTDRRNDYMFLGRYKQDLDYFFGNGNRCEKHLFFDTIEEHLAETRTLLESFEGEATPQWFTQEEMAEYERLGAQ